jgi:hypothetical protein
VEHVQRIADVKASQPGVALRASSCTPRFVAGQDRLNRIVREWPCALGLVRRD